MLQRRDNVLISSDLIEAEILSIDLPFVLDFSSEQDQEIFNEPIKSGEDGKARVMVRLKENEGAQIQSNIPGIITTMDINTRATLTRRVMTNSAMVFKADFHFPDEEETQESFDIGEVTIEEDGTIVVRNPNGQSTNNNGGEEEPTS